VSRITDLSAVTTSSRHCAETDCKKCRARFRWTRRKSWRSRKSFNLNPPIDMASGCWCHSVLLPAAGAWLACRLLVLRLVLGSWPGAGSAGRADGVGWVTWFGLVRPL